MKTEEFKQLTHKAVMPLSIRKLEQLSDAELAVIARFKRRDGNATATQNMILN